MRRPTALANAGLAIVFTVSLGLGLLVLPPSADDKAVAKDHEPKKDGLRVDDLPKPIPSFMKTIRGVGNRVGKEISKATGKGAKAVKESLKKRQPKGGRPDKR